MAGQILNPYLIHYRSAFAFSGAPLPASPWANLAIGCPSREGEIRAYQVPPLTLNGLASVYPPGESKDYVEQNRSTPSIPLAILAQAYQHLWPAQITTFINSSLMLRIPSFIAPIRVDAPRVEILSRFSLLAQDQGLHCHPSFTQNHCR